MELNFIITLIVFVIFAFICLWRTADRVTQLEALVKLLEREIKAIHEKESKNA